MTVLVPPPAPTAGPRQGAPGVRATLTLTVHAGVMTKTHFRPQTDRPRQPFGRSDRAIVPPRKHRLRTGGGLLRNFALGTGMVVALLGLAAAEDRGWLEWIDRADAWVEDMRASWSSEPTNPSATARGVSLCPPQYRRGGGGVTCITDGNSGVADGEPWRLTTRSGGVDAPEVGRPDCPAERTAGDRATRRLQSLMSSGYTMSGRRHDNNGRRLVVVKLADGRDAGLVLIEEGLAQPWPNSSNPWC